MSRFFIGQRCRIVGVGNTKDAQALSQIGREVRIISEWVHPFFLVEFWALDIGWDVMKSAASIILAPILTEGSDPSEFTYTELIESLHEMTGVAA